MYLTYGCQGKTCSFYTGNELKGLMTALDFVSVEIARSSSKLCFASLSFQKSTVLVTEF